MERSELIRVMELRQGSNVRRYHTEYIIGEQTVGHHSHGVAMLLFQFFPHMANSLTLVACLTHDLAESHSGDMPAPIKWGNPDLAMALDKVEAERLRYLGLKVSLSDVEKEAVKICDYLESMLFVYEQIRMGNRMMLPVFGRLYKWFENRILPKPVTELISQLNFEVMANA